MKRFMLGLGVAAALSFVMFVSLVSGIDRNAQAAPATNPTGKVYSVSWTVDNKVEFVTTEGLVYRIHQMDPATEEVTETGTMMGTDELAAYEKSPHLAKVRTNWTKQSNGRIYNSADGLLTSLDSDTADHTYLSSENLSVLGTCPIVSPGETAFITRLNGKAYLYTGTGASIGSPLTQVQMDSFSPDGRYYCYSPGGTTPKVVAIPAPKRSAI